MSEYLFEEWETSVVPTALVPDVPSAHQHVNPCIALYGLGPDGQTCKGCLHLRYHIQSNHKARFWKCDCRTLTHGRKTDHRVNWPACEKYEKREEEYHGG